MDRPLDRFFDEIADSYAEAIERCVPRYREMIQVLLDYLPKGFLPRSVLELGCGNGHLSTLLAQSFPEAEFRLVDLSAELLRACRARLTGTVKASFIHGSMEDLDFPPASLDLVASSISIHHIDHAGKASLFRKIHTWLGPAGIFTFSDQMAGETEDLYARHIDLWREEARALGVTDEEWAVWIDHQKAHDHHDTLQAHLQLLKEAGFSAVDGTWRHLLWTVIQARKGTAPEGGGQRA